MNNQPRGELVPGGLAMVYGLKSDPEDNGRIVTTIEKVFHGHKAPDGAPYFSRKEAWYCEARGLKTKKQNGALVETGYAYFSPANLLPINPSADPLEITQQHEVEA